LGHTLGNRYGAWDNTAKELISILAKGQDIAFIAEGDISFYSTFTYIARSVNNLAPSVQIEAISGICSPLAAAAALKIPLSIGNEKIAILPALYSIAELEKALDWAEVVILSKLSSVFREVWQLLAQKHLLEQASLVEWIGGQRRKFFRIY
jgi:precorrin-2/cobalt-factor-2 C20-methyltransferase